MLDNINDINQASKIFENKYNCETEIFKCKTNNTPILRISYNIPGLIECNNDNKDISFFNAILTYLKTDWYRDYIYTLPDIEKPTYIMWGDGTSITDNEYNILTNIYLESEIKFKWEKGDMLILNNLWWAHSRYPFEGERIILNVTGLPVKR